MPDMIKHQFKIEEFGGWNNKEKRWCLIYYFPRKPIFNEFLRHVKKFNGYHRWTWKIDPCLKIHFADKIYPNWKTIVCTEWYKRNGHIGFYFPNLHTYSNFINYVKTFYHDNTIFVSYLYENKTI